MPRPDHLPLKRVLQQAADRGASVAFMTAMGAVFVVARSWGTTAAWLGSIGARSRAFWAPDDARA